MNVNLPDGADDADIENISQMMADRYVWLGNRIFNDKITEPNEIAMHFYGGFVKTTTKVGMKYDENQKLIYPGVELEQYVQLPGYKDIERSLLLKSGNSRIGFDSEDYKKYIDGFKMANEFRASGARFSYEMDIDMRCYLAGVSRSFSPQDQSNYISTADLYAAQYAELLKRLNHGK